MLPLRAAIKNGTFGSYLFTRTFGYDPRMCKYPAPSLLTVLINSKVSLGSSTRGICVSLHPRMRHLVRVIDATWTSSLVFSLSLSAAWNASETSLVSHWIF